MIFTTRICAVSPRGTWNKAFLLAVLGLFGIALAPAQAESDSKARWAAAILDSIEHHPRLLAARSAQDLAFARAEAAAQPLYEPQLGLEWRKRGVQSAVSNFEFSLAQQIDIAGKNEARSKRLSLDGEAAHQDNRLLREDLLATLLNALGDRWFANHLLEVAKVRRERMALSARLLEKHAASGRISTHEVDQAYLEVAEAEHLLAEFEQEYLNSAFQVSELAGDVAIPNHLPIDELVFISERTQPETLLQDLPAVAAARRRYEASRAALEAVETERQLDPSVGMIAGRDEGDTYIGVNMAIPLALRSSTTPFKRASSQEALHEEQRYRDIYRVAKSRVETASAVYRGLFAHWRNWRELTGTRVDTPESTLRSLWDAGKISGGEFLNMIVSRENASISGVRLTGRVWKAWIEWLAACGRIETWLRGLRGSEATTDR